MKCEIPSFVSDLVQVHSWVDNEDNVYLKDSFLQSKQFDENFSIRGMSKVH